MESSDGKSLFLLNPFGEQLDYLLPLTAKLRRVLR